MNEFIFKLNYSSNKSCSVDEMIKSTKAVQQQFNHSESIQDVIDICKSLSSFIKFEMLSFPIELPELDLVFESYVLCAIFGDESDIAFMKLSIP